MSPCSCGSDLPVGMEVRICIMCDARRLTTLSCACVQPVKDRCYLTTYTCRLCGCVVSAPAVKEAA
jgi:hypothetical protein